MDPVPSVLSPSPAVATSPPAKADSRSVFWPKEAYLSVANYRKRQRLHLCENELAELREIITQIAALTGYRRERCWRFARRLGVKGKRKYRAWTTAEQQRLLHLVARNPVCEVAKIMHRPLGSIRSMLIRLGAHAEMGRDWFTIHTLAKALHARPSTVEAWVDRGWLRTRRVETGRLTRDIIERDAFVEFCTSHARDVVGNRLREDRIDFVRDFVFAPSHADLLAVRESKKERAAFDLLMNGSDDEGPEEHAAYGHAAGDERQGAVSGIATDAIITTELDDVAT